MYLNATEEICTTIIHQVCNDTFTKKKPFTRFKPVYWNQQIADARKDYLETKRQLTRIRKKQNVHTMAL